MSDTFIPAANVWVGEYPYLDKVSQTGARRDANTWHGAALVTSHVVLWIVG